MIINKIPIGRLAKAEEIADGVLFLLSDSSSYITGEILDINGGLMMD
jgi:3-oxoacyl-[acyl-carrier protein] reductase